MLSSGVFNSSLEAGLRVLIFLDSYYPEQLDFEGVMKVDYVLVNSTDFQGPPSLHPTTPNRLGELSSRHKVLREGIELMKRFGLVDVFLSREGIFYSSTESAEPFLSLIKTDYSKSLMKVSDWLSSELKDNGFEKIDISLSEMEF